MNLQTQCQYSYTINIGGIHEAYSDIKDSNDRSVPFDTDRVHKGQKVTLSVENVFGMVVSKTVTCE